MVIIAPKMHYPSQLKPITNNLSLYIPDYKEVKGIYENLLKSNPNEPFPYWTKLWAASIALVQYLKSNPNWIEGKNVIEIGAGLGLPSFSIANIAKSITITDNVPEAVELFKKNIQQLKTNNIQAMVLDWNEVPDQIKPEVVILSDVNYNPLAFVSLWNLIKRFIESGSYVILSTPQRISASPFVNALEAFIKQKHIEIVNENGNQVEISILVLYK